MQKNKEYKIDKNSLVKLCRDFQADCFDGFVSNDESYIEHWLNKYERKKKLEKLSE